MRLFFRLYPNWSSFVSTATIFTKIDSPAAGIVTMFNDHYTCAWFEREDTQHVALKGLRAPALNSLIFCEQI